MQFVGDVQIDDILLRIEIDPLTILLLPLIFSPYESQLV